MDYVLKYSEDIMLKYHEWKRNTSWERLEKPAPQKTILDVEPTVSEGEMQAASYKGFNNAGGGNAAPKNLMTKHAGSGPVLNGLKRKADAGAAKMVEKATSTGTKYVNIPEDEAKSEEASI